jgi:hypothetical protein
MLAPVFMNGAWNGDDSGDVRLRDAVFACTKRRKKANAQRLSPVTRWAFYTVACTALCGPLAKAEQQALARRSYPRKLADGIVARSAPRGKGHHGTNRDI